MKVFVVLYGLMAIVPAPDGLWVLLPDTARSHYADSMHAQRHHADVAVRGNGHAFMRVLSLMGDELILTGSGTAAPDIAGDALVYSKKLLADPRVNPECIASYSANCAIDGRRLLAGRIKIKGSAIVRPFYVTRASSGEGPLVPASSPSSDIDTWAFRLGDSPQRFGTYEGRFANAVIVALTVPSSSANMKSSGGQSDETLSLTAANQTTCNDYLYPFTAGSGFSTGELSTCNVIWVTNLPIHGEAWGSDSVDRDHTELLFDLLANRNQPQTAMYRRSRDSPGGGSSPSTLCAGIIMEP